MFCMLAVDLFAATFAWTPADRCPQECAVLSEPAWNGQMEDGGVRFSDGTFFLPKFRVHVLPDKSVCLRRDDGVPTS